MTPEENNIMRDAFYFLRDHINPPAIGTDECAEFFSKAAQELSQLVSVTWNNHPLAIEILIALCNYIEGKAKKKTEEADHV